MADLAKEYDDAELKHMLKGPFEQEPAYPLTEEEDDKQDGEPSTKRRRRKSDKVNAQPAGDAGGE